MVQSQHNKWLEGSKVVASGESAAAALAKNNNNTACELEQQKLDANVDATTTKRNFIEQIFHLADTGELSLQDIMDESNSMILVVNFHFHFHF